MLLAVVTGFRTLLVSSVLFLPYLNSKLDLWVIDQSFHVRALLLKCQVLYCAGQRQRWSGLCCPDCAPTHPPGSGPFAAGGQEWQEVG